MFGNHEPHAGAEFSDDGSAAGAHLLVEAWSAIRLMDTHSAWPHSQAECVMIRQRSTDQALGQGQAGVAWPT
jgi:hypothetical protein